MAYTGAYPFVIDSTLGVDFSKTYTANPTTNPELPQIPFEPGTKVIGSQGSEWVLCLCEAAAPAQGDFVLIQASGDSGSPAAWSAGQLTSAVGKSQFGALVGVSGGAPTVGQYFWVQRSGMAVNANFVGGVTKYAQLHTSATAGQLTQTAVGGTSAAVNGVVFNNATVQGGTQAWLNFPVIGAND